LTYALTTDNQAPAFYRIVALILTILLKSLFLSFKVLEAEGLKRSQGNRVFLRLVLAVAGFGVVKLWPDKSPGNQKFWLPRAGRHFFRVSVLVKRL
jgi:hypothetical protein